MVETTTEVVHSAETASIGPRRTFELRLTRSVTNQRRLYLGQCYTDLGFVQRIVLLCAGNGLVEVGHRCKMRMIGGYPMDDDLCEGERRGHRSTRNTREQTCFIPALPE